MVLPAGTSHQLADQPEHGGPVALPVLGLIGQPQALAAGKGIGGSIQLPCPAATVGQTYQKRCPPRFGRVVASFMVFFLPWTIQTIERLRTGSSTSGRNS